MTSTAYPFATALHESIIRGSVFTTFPSSDNFTFSYPVISSRLSIMAESGKLPFLKPNPQALAKGGNGDIEGTIGLLGDFHASVEDVGKECVGHNVLVAVDARNSRRIIERGQGTVKTFEFCFYFSLQILVALISHFIYRTEYQSIVCLIRSGLVVAGKYPDGAQHQ